MACLRQNSRQLRFPVKVTSFPARSLISEWYHAKYLARSQSSIAHYRITSKLGEGGMGEVWRATDTKLNRDVALKVLPECFAADPDRLARFTREAQVLASLNHPNIAAIYGVEDRALVME